MAHVLVVDDDHDTRDALEVILRREKHTVLTAASGDEAATRAIAAGSRRFTRACGGSIGRAVGCGTDRSASAGVRTAQHGTVSGSGRRLAASRDAAGRERRDGVVRSDATRPADGRPLPRH